MQLDRLTTKAQEALEGAQETARSHSHQEVDAEHLLAALIGQTDSLVPALLEKLGAPPAQLAKELEAELERLATLETLAAAKLEREQAAIKAAADARAMKALSGTIAIYAGSRYAYINGDKVRLDDKDILRGEAIIKDGKIFVPESFAGAIASKSFTPKAIPKGLEILASRWVYDISRPKINISEKIAKIETNGSTYIDIAGFAKSLGKQIHKLNEVYCSLAMI